MLKPKEINISGIKYKIEYCDKPSDVDVFRRESLWGQIDYWTRTIRVFDRDRPIEDIWITIIHEILHAIIEDLKIKQNFKDGKEEEIVGLLSLALADILFRNNLIGGR